MRTLSQVYDRAAQRADKLDESGKDPRAAQRAINRREKSDLAYSAFVSANANWGVGQAGHAPREVAK